MGVAAIVVLFPGAAVSGAAEPFVFEGSRTNDYDPWGVWYVGANGTPRLILSNGENPTLSPEGARVAALQGDCIKLIQLNSAQPPRSLTCGLSNVTPRTVPEWSPDGDSLLFATHESVYSLALDGTLQTIDTAWPRGLERPVFSPDGTQVAFSATFDTAGEPVPRTAYVANADFTNPIKLPASSGWDSRDPVFSPDGTRLAYLVYDYPNVEHADFDFVIADAGGTNTRRLTFQDDLDHQMPSWLPDGHNLAASRAPHDEGGPSLGVLINADNGALTPLLPDWHWIEDIHYRPSSSPAIDWEEALVNYRPRLRYDLTENYYADSASTLTDYPLNVLRREGDPVIADHDAATSAPEFDLSFLGAMYPTGDDVEATDVLDANGDDANAAYTMHTNPAYANHVYGRVFHDFDTRIVWLQYWLFYYYNDNELLGIGGHEGDWEYVQIGFDSDSGTPLLASYAQHNEKGETCPYSAILTEPRGSGPEAPVVYVASGGHASYFRPGDYDRPWFGVAVLPTDHARGDGSVVDPTLSLLPLTGWTDWPGFWGGSDPNLTTSFGTESPHGPQFEHPVKWNDPTGFAVSLDGCRELDGDASMTALRESLNAPPTAYNFPGGVATVPTRPYVLDMTIKPQNDPAQTRRHKVYGDHGTSSQPVPPAPGPYRVFIQARSRRGLSSPVSEAKPTTTG